MSIKIIHMADCHLDSAFSGLAESGKSAVRREEMRMAFAKGVSYAREADFLFISGDLFDSDTVSRTTLDFVKKQFASIPDTKIFICAGNHDSLQEKSVYNTVDFGENVHIFSTEGDCVETELADIYGISFSTPNDDRKLLDRIRIQNKDKINLLVMHANLQAEGYNPVTPAEIALSGMDYAALGHIHQRSELLKNANTYYAYPGCIEGRGFDETGECGVLSLTVDKGIVNAEFLPTQRRMYLEEAVDISGCADYEEIDEKIRPVYQGERHIYRIRLIGEAAFPINCDIIKEKINGFSVQVRDETRAPFDAEAESGAFTLKGLYVKFAMADRDVVSEETFARAFKTGLALIEKEERNEN